MKIQLLTALTVLALSATTAHAEKSYGYSSGTDITNNSRNALAIGKSTAGGSSTSNGAFGIGGGSSSHYLTVDAGRSIAGSIVLEGGACACDFDDIKNTSRNAIAVGNATAGSIHINTMVKPNGNL